MGWSCWEGCSAAACVGERFCSWGFAGLSAWPCPGAVLGHGGGLSPASSSAARGVTAEGSSGCCLGVAVPSIGDTGSCLRCHPPSCSWVVEATRSIFSSTRADCSGLTTSASRGSLGTLVPCCSDLFEGTSRLSGGSSLVTYLQFCFPSCKTEEKFGKGGCKLPCPGHGCILARRGAVGAPAPKSSPRVGTDASRAPLGGGTGRAAGGARWGSGGARLTLPGAGGVGSAGPGAERVPRRLGGGMGAMGEQGASTQVSMTGVAGAPYRTRGGLRCLRGALLCQRGPRCG